MSEVIDAIELTPAQIENIKEAIKQTDAIFSLEGFEPDEEMRAVDAAVLAGRITFGQAAEEMRDYAMEHKTMNGFIASRPWA